VVALLILALLLNCTRSHFDPPLAASLSQSSPATDHSCGSGGTMDVIVNRWPPSNRAGNSTKCRTLTRTKKKSALSSPSVPSTATHTSRRLVPCPKITNRGPSCAAQRHIEGRLFSVYFVFSHHPRIAQYSRDHLFALPAFIFRTSIFEDLSPRMAAWICDRRENHHRGPPRRLDEALPSDQSTG